jgi:hypothetical protein
MLKDKFCSNNPHTDDDVTEDIQEVVCSISPAELAMQNMFVRYDGCL